MKVITAEELQHLMEMQSPNYDSSSEGYILVNTLPEAYFRKEHIPLSLNVTLENLSELKNHFEPSKHIIVYCATETCDSSERAANELERMGFMNVIDFTGGMAMWKEMDGVVKSGESQPEISANA